MFDQQEERALLEVLHSGRWWSGTQAYHDANSVDVPSKVAAFESSFAAYCGATYGLACATGTAALEIALKAAGIGPGDEVIVPPYTFLATASAPLLIGAIPVFCDIQADTLNLDPDRLEEAITPYTRAIIPVHFAGLAADMERIMAIGRAHNLFVLEDAAHAHGATSNGRHLGTLGDAGTFSFQASKNMTAGEGGLILTKFHFHIAEVSGCLALRQMLEANQVLTFNWLYYVAARRPALPLHFHSELAEALCTRDEEAADRAMRAHIRFGLDNVINGMTPELDAAAAVR